MKQKHYKNTQTSTNKKQQMIKKKKTKFLKPFDNGCRALTCNAKFIITKNVNKHTTNQDNNKQLQPTN